MSKTSIIEWNEGTTPQVPDGDMECFFVTNKTGYVFLGYYLNNHLLHYEDGCPDANEANKWRQCPGCDSGDGHPCTGWYSEYGSEDEPKYQELEIVAWAVRPKFEATPCPSPHGSDNG